MEKVDKKRVTKVSIYQNLSNDQQYKASTGLTISEFSTLFCSFDKLYNFKKGSGLKNLYNPLFTDKKEALFFILYHLKSGVTYEILGLSFGISLASAHNYIKILKPILKATLESFSVQPVRVFESQEDFDSFFKDVEISIDATEIRTQRPADNTEQSDNYSGKKKTIQENG